MDGKGKTGLLRVGTGTVHTYIFVDFQTCGTGDFIKLRNHFTSHFQTVFRGNFVSISFSKRERGGILFYVIDLSADRDYEFKTTIVEERLVVRERNSERN